MQPLSKADRGIPAALDRQLWPPESAIAAICSYFLGWRLALLSLRLWFQGH